MQWLGRCISPIAAHVAVVYTTTSTAVLCQSDVAPEHAAATTRSVNTCRQEDATRAAEAFRLHGFVVVRDALSPNLAQSLRAELAARFEAREHVRRLGNRADRRHSVVSALTDSTEQALRQITNGHADFGPTSYTLSSRIAPL
jgi:hypothetical protein